MHRCCSSRNMLAKPPSYVFVRVRRTRTNTRTITSMQPGSLVPKIGVRTSTVVYEVPPEGCSTTESYIHTFYIISFYITLFNGFHAEIQGRPRAWLIVHLSCNVGQTSSLRPSSHAEYKSKCHSARTSRTSFVPAPGARWHRWFCSNAPCCSSTEFQRILDSI